MSTETLSKHYIKKGLRSLWVVLGLVTALSSSTVMAAEDDIELTADPLFMKQMSARPSLVLDLSVEFPTVGAAYREGFNPATEYIGYFNQYKCYQYDKSKDYFVMSGNAGSLKCPGSADFSGNFLNWATSSAIDMLRYSLTGGDRIVDTSTNTVLQRAVLPDNFYGNGNNFPVKTLNSGIAGDHVPTALKTTGTGTTHNGNIIIYSCNNKIFFRTGAGGGCGDTGKNAATLGTTVTNNKIFFQTRVEVCATSSGTLQDIRKVQGVEIPYCYKYPNGNYKPIGKLQQNSEQLRVAAFGYPMINSRHPTNSYHAVLRAPMKYLGPVYYDDDYKIAAEENPNKEWDANTGVFVQNPEGPMTLPGGTTTSVSGVINYLNQFGRSGTYKTYDQTAYLYYESLRYLQGLKPTTNATSVVSGNFWAYDNFPIILDWVDPHPKLSFDTLGNREDYSCFKNNIIAIGDIHTHDDSFIPGFTTPQGVTRASNISRNIPNFYNWTRVVRGYENNSNVSYKDARGVTRNTAKSGGGGWNPTPNTWANIGSLENLWTGSHESRYTIAGMAYWANTHDIRGVDVTKYPDADEKWTDFSEAISTDPVRPGMRVTTYFIDVNEMDNSGTAAKRDSNQYRFAGKYGGFDESRSFEDSGNPYTTDGVNSSNGLWMRGSVAERLPQNFYLASDSVAMVQAFDYIFESILRDTSNVISGIGSTSGYTSLVKSGDIVFQANFSTSGWSGDVRASVASVDASGKLTMNLISGWSPADKLNAMKDSLPKINGTGGNAGRKIILGTKVEAGSGAVDFDKTSGSALGLTEDEVNYLRGYNGTVTDVTFRSRSSILGDIINSYPVYKGAPNAMSYDLDYRTFYTTHNGRTPVVYVGANDGMLHAFDASFEKTSTTTAKTKGSSGSELFAYIPSFVSKNLINLTKEDYKHQGFVDAPLTVAEAKVGSNWKTVLVGGAGSGGKGVFALDVTNPTSFSKTDMMWEFTEDSDETNKIGNVLGAPVFARLNVYESKEATESKNKWFAFVPSGVNSATGSVGVYVLDLSKDTSDGWSKNLNYFWLPIKPVASRPQGIVNIKVITDSQSNFKALYVGDLSGQVTKVTFDKVIEGSGISNLSDTTKVLFTAPVNQSISMPVSVFNYGKLTFVSFGTGKYLEEEDTKDTNFKQQAVYTIVDSNKEVTLSKLAKMTINTSTKEFGSSIAGLSWTTENLVDEKAKAGWYLNLPEVGSGERMIYQMQVVNGVVIANSMMPSRGGCSTGASTQYRFDMGTGKGTVSNLDTKNGVYGGVYLVEGDTVFTVNPDTGETTGTTSVTPGGSSSNQEFSQTGDPLSSAGLNMRTTLREVNNYDKVRHTFVPPEE